MDDQQQKSQVELWVPEDIQFGEVIRMGYPGYPVLGTTQIVPLILKYRNPEKGESETLRLALSMECLSELVAQASGRLDERISESGSRLN